MKKKWMLCLAASVMLISLSGGCAKTPEESLVKQKGQAGMKNYEEGTALKETVLENEKTGTETEENNALRKALNAPEKYQNEKTDETGKLTILTDAEVYVPDADKVSAILVSQHPFDQEVMDSVTETFFSDAKIYSAESYYQLTKADYQTQIEALEGYVAEGNLDPYEYGTDEEGNPTYDIYSQIQQLKELYQQAPEERTLTEVHPQFGLPEDDGMGGVILNETHFLGVAVQEDGTAFDYQMSSYNGSPMEIKIIRKQEQKDPFRGIWWTEYSGIEATGSDRPDPKEMEKKTGISYEDALKIAWEKVENLNIEFIELTDWEYTVLREDQVETPRAMGFQFSFTRNINGIPITNTAAYGGALEDMDSEMETWGYERLDMIVSKEGIEQVIFLNLYDIGEAKTENLNLLPFSDIMEIYEKMMLVQNADVLNYENSRTYKVDRIVFGYSRIYEPSSSSTEGILVPVWDFFGKMETSSDVDGKTIENTSGLRSQSYLTLNAVDGSVIDRGLGY